MQFLIETSGCNNYFNSSIFVAYMYMYSTGQLRVTVYERSPPPPPMTCITLVTYAWSDASNYVCMHWFATQACFMRACILHMCVYRSCVLRLCLESNYRYARCVIWLRYVNLFWPLLYCTCIWKRKLHTCRRTHTCIICKWYSLHTQDDLYSTKSITILLISKHY